MIHLNPLTEQEFQDYLAFMISDHAREITKNFNLTLQAALEESEMMMSDLWKDGLLTEGQYLYNIQDSKTYEKVGILWYGLIPEINQAYVYHIFIDDLHRRKGYGKKTLEMLQSMLSECEKRDGAIAKRCATKDGSSRRTSFSAKRRPINICCRTGGRSKRGYLTY
ncbi:GNAT family N-acetyltransferase [Fictibacillus sp. Sa2CUA10]|uniref:GNAT family N-acetyltransferase n=1 Tax=Fictibacillus norfolkensis TaxID=2762233 RepID=A0ABR8SJD9_9BACL|nr:GNAT family N-acetyltransferase [Fictibacillus norfolkensis]